MPSVLIRIFSALIALTVLFTIYFQFHREGLKYICFVAPLIGAYEISRILFKHHDSKFLRVFFAIGVLSIFSVGVYHFQHVALGFALISILFCSISIIFEKKFSDLNTLSLFQAKSILGFFYVGLLPALAVQVLNLPQGNYWFFALLTTVFMGDTFAFVFGLLWGKKKILPSISPKKTVVGSLGGLLGSVLGMLIVAQYLAGIPKWSLMILAIAVGALAQLGDMFESMLKRVANIKDSGSIMPGHGGILDRLDGILFGAPILLAGANFIIYFFAV